MKKFLLVLIMAAFFVAGTAVAEPPAESSVKYLDSLGVWQDNPAEYEDRDARLWRMGDEFSGNCNKKYWSHDVSVTASIAQWIDFSLSYTQFDWYIRKPGTYAGNCIAAWIASNSDILIDYDGFDSLMPAIVGNNPIPVWYSFETDGGWPEVNAGWVEATDLNDDDDTILDCTLLHYGIVWKLWNKIKVVECNSACEYSDYATITITLNNQKDWIVWDTGEWGQLPVIPDLP